LRSHSCRKISKSARPTGFRSTSRNRFLPHKEIKARNNFDNIEETVIPFDAGLTPRVGEITLYYFNTLKQKFELVRYAGKEFITAGIKSVQSSFGEISVHAWSRNVYIVYDDDATGEYLLYRNRAMSRLKLYKIDHSKHHMNGISQAGMVHRIAWDSTRDITETCLGLKIPAVPISGYATGRTSHVAIAKNGFVYQTCQDMHGQLQQIRLERMQHPERIFILESRVIMSVSCGAQHTIAIDNVGFVFSWGFGAHG
jgi:hypothetical protein